MNLKKTIITLITIIVLIVGFSTWQIKHQNHSGLDSVKSTPKIILTIISTLPTPLENSTISPSQPIEITFSKPISISQFKYKIDPEIEHEVASTSGDSSFGQTFRITFKKPLELGAAFTLTVNPDTKLSDQEKLDKEYIYHIKTIGYKGA